MMEQFQNIMLTLLAAALCGLFAFIVKVNKQKVLQLATDLINRAETAIQGSGMGVEKKALVIAQLETAGVRVTAWLSRQIDVIVKTLNARGAWLASKTQESISGMTGGNCDERYLQ